MKKISLLCLFSLAVLSIFLVLSMIIGRLGVPAKEFQYSDLQLGKLLEDGGDCYVNNEVYQNTMCRIIRNHRETYVAVNYKSSIIYIDYIIPTYYDLNVGDLVLKFGPPIARWRGVTQTILFWKHGMAFTKYNNFSPYSHITFVGIGGFWERKSFPDQELWAGFKN